ncbi:hypothetical protein OK074_5034 [Actinobacteria bacterium OK074]|nr:hypothetical protein OK074_5034 [Actinobacteria bacterium OK074]
MTSPPTVAERLLALGAGFTRHHDALHNHTLLIGPDPVGALAQIVTSSQTLVEDALDVSAAVRTMPRLTHTADIRAVMERTTQLASLAMLAANHLLDAGDILRYIYPRPASEPRPAVTRGDALVEAGRCATLARRLTSLGSEDCLAAAGLLARELHRQRLGPGHPPPALTPAQRTALEAVAAGHVTLGEQSGTPYVSRGPARITITTIRALEARSLVAREPGPLMTHDERLHLTPDGCRALAALLDRSGSAPPTAMRPSARPAASTARGTAR